MKMLIVNLLGVGFSSSGPVLCVVMSSNGEQCYSGGTDGLIHGWNTTNPNIDPYDSYGTLLSATPTNDTFSAVNVMWLK